MDVHKRLNLASDKKLRTFFRQVKNLHDFETRPADQGMPAEPLFAHSIIASLFFVSCEIGYAHLVQVDAEDDLV